MSGFSENNLPKHLRQAVRIFVKRSLRIKRDLKDKPGGWGVRANWTQKDLDWRDRKLQSITQKCSKLGLSKEDRNSILEEAFKEAEAEKQASSEDEESE